MSDALIRRTVEAWRPAFDPVLIFTAAGMTPDPWQEEALRATDRQVAILGSRQSGKSETVAAKGLHAALFESPATVVVLSAGARQATELYLKILKFYRPWQSTFPAASETQRELRLANGSRILSVPADEGRIRGLSAVSVLLIDEAAEVADSLYFASRPFLAAVPDARLFAITSAKRPRGWFFAEWTDGGDSWRRFKVPASDCPRISPRFLEEERRSLGEVVFATQYLCEWREESGVIDPRDLLVKPGSALAASLDRAFGSGDLPEALVP